MPGRVFRSRRRRDAHTDVPPDRGPPDRQGDHHRASQWSPETLLTAFFERDDIELRLRPHYFPFIEPRPRSTSADRRRRAAAWWRREGWMELLGCGMVHPSVLALGGSIQTSGRVSPSASGSIGWRCSNMEWTICARSSRRSALDQALRFLLARRTDADGRRRRGVMKFTLTLAEGPPRHRRRCCDGRRHADPHRAGGRGRRQSRRGADAVHASRGC